MMDNFIQKNNREEKTMSTERDVCEAVRLYLATGS